MKYTRDNQGYLRYVDNEGNVGDKVPEDKEMSNPYMFSVDDEADDAYEDSTNGVWTE